MAVYRKWNKWAARAYLRATYELPRGKYLFLGYYDTQQEAREAVQAWTERKYGNAVPHGSQ